MVKSQTRTSHIACEWNIKPVPILYLKAKLEWKRLICFLCPRVGTRNSWVDKSPLTRSLALYCTFGNTSPFCTGAVIELNELNLREFWTWSYHLIQRTGAAGQAHFVCRSHLPVAWKNAAIGSSKPAPFKLKGAAEKSRLGGHKSKRPCLVRTQPRDKTNPPRNETQFVSPARQSFWACAA